MKGNAVHTFRSLVRRSAAALIAAAGFLAALGPAQAQAQTTGVALFSDANYSSVGTLTRSSVPDLASFGNGWAGRISSLRVLGAVAVAAYSEPNYGGRCETFTTQDGWLGDNAIGNDAIRSIKVGYTCFGQVPGRVVVTDVAVVKGSTPGIACPRGYTKKLQDLNQGAGGDYVYLCMKWGPRTTQEVIRRVEVRDDVSAGLARRACTGDDGRLVEGDLNSGVSSSDYIMFCVFSRTQATPVLALRDVDFIVSNDDMVCYTPFVCNDSNWERDISAACARKLGAGAFGYVDDLNKGAGGKYIYLCLKSTDADVPITQVNDSPPTLQRTGRTPANAAGWNRSDVQVTWQCTAGGSPLTSPASIVQTVSGERANQSAVATCADLAGHTVTDKVTGINIDATPPHARLRSRTATNATGWNRADVVVNWECTDGTSGPEQDTVSDTLTSEGADLTARATCHDRAGNEATAALAGIDIDRTPPAMTLISRSPQPTPDGWYNRDVDVVWACADSLSGVESAGREVTASATGEGMARTATGNCHDRAGNRTFAERRVGIDRTGPVMTASASTGDGVKYTPGTWTSQDVTVKFHCTDALSGTAALPAPQTISRSGADQTVSGRCTDKAGNETVFDFGGVKIDQIAPTISVTRKFGPESGQITVGFSCGDELSGIASCPEPIVVDTEKGSRGVAGMAVDHAGNRTKLRIDDITVDPAVN